MSDRSDTNALVTRILFFIAPLPDSSSSTPISGTGTTQLIAARGATVDVAHPFADGGARAGWSCRDEPCLPGQPRRRSRRQHRLNATMVRCCRGSGVTDGSGSPGIPTTQRAGRPQELARLRFGFR